MRGPSICDSCRHVLTEDVQTGVLTCKAFPNGVPDDIAGGEIDHRAPYDGDHGIRWTMMNGDAGPRRLRMWETFAQSVLSP